MHGTWKNYRGLTLIELMVALVISSVTIAALYRTLIGQQKTLTVQEELVDMRQNVRGAITYKIANGELDRDDNTSGGNQPLTNEKIIESVQYAFFDSQGNPAATDAAIQMIRVTIRAKTNDPDPQYKTEMGTGGGRSLPTFSSGM